MQWVVNYYDTTITCKEQSLNWIRLKKNDNSVCIFDWGKRGHQPAFICIINWFYWLGNCVVNCRVSMTSWIDGQLSSCIM